LCPIRKIRSILRAQKTLAEIKPHKGRKPGCGFSQPEPPSGGEAVTTLLGAGLSFSLLFHSKSFMLISFL
jgi:RecA/RadA recombinase